MGFAGPLRPIFFFNDTATTEIYTLSLHDALPISTPTVNAAATVPLNLTDVVPVNVLPEITKRCRAYVSSGVTVHSRVLCSVCVIKLLGLSLSLVALNDVVRPLTRNTCWRLVAFTT